MTVVFTHESGAPRYEVPGYFAADGDAANSSATSGNKWRVHVSPDKVGRWNWRASFVAGPNVALLPTATGQATAPVDGATGSFEVTATNKTAPDFRARGRLQYVGKHYLRFAGSGEYFQKAGADAPETLLAYEDFDNTRTLKTALHTYAPHVQDWKAGDPGWKGGKGKGLIGAVNYLSSKGANAMSFLTYNAGGDGDNVWPFVDRDDKLHYDVSKLDQWQIVFDHAQAEGIYLHFKLQETENDDGTRRCRRRSRRARRRGPRGCGSPRPRRDARERGCAPHRRHPAPPRLGEQRPARAVEEKDVAAPGAAGCWRRCRARWRWRSTAATPGARDVCICASSSPVRLRARAQLEPRRREHADDGSAPRDDPVHPRRGSRTITTSCCTRSRTCRRRSISRSSARPISPVCHCRTPGTRRISRRRDGCARRRPPVCPGSSPTTSRARRAPACLRIPDTRGSTGKDNQGNPVQSLHDIRKLTLWGNLMAGGGGVEYYFGYTLPDNDLTLESFRSRDKSWDYARIALTFFRTERIPFWEMSGADLLVGNQTNDNSVFGFAKAGELYLVYLPNGGTADLDLSGVSGQFTVSWFDPRNGGALKKGSVATVAGGKKVTLGAAPASPAEDWLVVVRK